MRGITIGRARTKQEGEHIEVSFRVRHARGGEVTVVGYGAAARHRPPQASAPVWEARDAIGQLVIVEHMSRHDAIAAAVRYLEKV